jgi:peptide/nickel transport system substrate-binding protein
MHAEVRYHDGDPYVIFTPNFPIRLFEVASTLRGFEPVNPFGMINPENWYYVDD